jgi:hypothetical protein
MAFEGKQRFIERMLGLLVHIAVGCAIAIIEIGLLLWRLSFGKVFKRGHFADVPNFEQLVFRIGGDINSIELAAHVSNTLRMSNEDTDRPTARQGPPVPHLDERIVTAAQEDVAMLPVSEAH